MTAKLRCGDAEPALRNLVSRDSGGGVPALFAGRRASYSFNTRVAIRRAVDLLGLKPGDEILAPAYNCGSELDPLRAAGLTVRFFAVDRRSHIDPDEVARQITPATRGVYLTHFFGFLQPATAALRALCDDRGLVMIEDCALSLLSGSSPAEGRAGDIAVFCLSKLFPVLAGGVMVVNSDKVTGPTDFAAAPPLAQVAKPALRMALAMLPGGPAAIGALRRLRRGTPPAAADVAPEPGHPDMPGHYYFDPATTDARISRLAAWPIRAFDVDRTIHARRANYRAYLAELPSVPGAVPLFPDLPDAACPLNMPVLVENRDALARVLQAQGIAATPWWAGYHRGFNIDAFPDATFLKDHVLTLPLHQDLGPPEVNFIVDRLRAAIG